MQMSTLGKWNRLSRHIRWVSYVCMFILCMIVTWTWIWNRIASVLGQLSRKSDIDMSWERTCSVES
jgi:hypothetical protein